MANLDDLREPLKTAVEAEYRRRFPPRADHPSAHERGRAVRSTTVQTARDRIERWRRARQRDGVVA